MVRHKEKDFSGREIHLSAPTFFEECNLDDAQIFRHGFSAHFEGGSRERLTIDGVSNAD